MDIKFVTIILDSENNIKHQCYYENIPNIASIRDLFRELVEDEEFGMIDQEYVDNLRIIIMDIDDMSDENKETLTIKDMIEHFKDM